jgi:hypothetical protein
MSAVDEQVMWKYGPISSKRAQKFYLPSLRFLLTLWMKGATKSSGGWWEPKWGLILGTYVGVWSPPAQHHKFRMQRCHCHLLVRSTRLSAKDAVYWQRQYLPPDRKPILSVWLSDYHMVGNTFPVGGGGRGLAYHYERLRNSDVDNLV